MRELNEAMRLPGRNLLLAVLAAALFTAFVVGTRLAKSRDELFEQYEKYALSEIAREAPSLLRKGLSAVQDKKGWNLAALEGQYGSDPRYWQLRSAMSWGNVKEHAEYRAAVERGVYDEATFEAISFWYGGEKEDADEKTLALFDKAIATAPDNAWYYYRKADLQISLGELEAARELLRKGNAAKRCYTPLTFPTSEAFNRVGKAKNEDEKAALGYILSMEHIDIPNYIRIKDQFRNANLAFAMGYPLEFGDELLLRTKRMGQSEDKLTLSANVAAVLARVILHYVHDEILTLTPAQEEEYKALDAKLGEVKTILKAAEAETIAKLGPAPVLQKNVMGSVTNRTRQHYVRLYEEEVIYQQYRPKLAACFDSLATPPLALWVSGKTLETTPARE